MLESLVRLVLQQFGIDSQLRHRNAEARTHRADRQHEGEEQIWLRTLAQKMRLCESGHDVTRVARDLLTALQGLLQAESLACLEWPDAGEGRFWEPTTSGDFDDGWPDEPRPDCSPATQQPSDSSGMSAPPWTGRSLWVGPQRGTDALWCRWFAELAGTTRSTRVILAGFNELPPVLAAHGAESVVAVPMVWAGRIRGWVMAINRGMGPSADGHRGPVESAEFSTAEVHLLESAASLIATHAHNVDLLRRQEDRVLGVVRSMSSAIDARDPYTRGHSLRVAGIARRIARQLALSPVECERLHLCGLLHDVGKIGIPDRILLKPGQLDEEEFFLMQQHPVIGHRIVQNLEQFEDLLPGILHHHESVDGAGYPDGLVGDEIPLMARIVAVADAFDAMTSDRPYRGAMSRTEACRVLAERAGIQWDRDVVQAFLHSLSAPPAEHHDPQAAMLADNPWDSVVAAPA
jgi:HD-GYP domain-containing protein (c-di-GMP phosphodiesterase class II)